MICYIRYSINFNRVVSLEKKNRFYSGLVILHLSFVPSNAVLSNTEDVVRLRQPWRFTMTLLTSYVVVDGIDFINTANRA